LRGVRRENGIATGIAQQIAIALEGAKVLFIIFAGGKLRGVDEDGSYIFLIFFARFGAKG
jgi:hypothetical protein